MEYDPKLCPYRNIEIRWFLKEDDETVDTDKPPVVIHGFQGTRDRYSVSIGRDPEGQCYEGMAICPYSTESDELAIDRLLNRIEKNFDDEIRQLKRTKRMLRIHLSRVQDKRGDET